MATQRVTMREDDLALREHLLYVFKGDGAHLEFEAAVKDIPRELLGSKADGAAHTPWQLLEHMRISQRDVLDSLRDPKHVSPEFPDGYWPVADAPPSGDALQQSAEQFHADLQAIAEIVEDDSRDLFAILPGTDGQTIARKVLMIADHTSYHLGQLVLLRRILNCWG